MYHLLQHMLGIKLQSKYISQSNGVTFREDTFRDYNYWQNNFIYLIYYSKYQFYERKTFLMVQTYSMVGFTLIWKNFNKNIKLEKKLWSKSRSGKMYPFYGSGEHTVLFIHWNVYSHEILCVAPLVICYQVEYLNERLTYWFPMSKVVIFSSP